MTNQATALPLEGLNFSQILVSLKQGFQVRRASWNAKNQYITLINGKSIQESIDANYGNGETGYLIQDFFMIKSAQDTLNTWVPSISDILANDWEYYRNFN